MNENYLKKIDDTIDQVNRKKGSTFNLELLIQFVISKLNTNSSNDETTSALENILIKLFQSGFGNTVRVYCYYILANFNNEFSSSFYTSIASEINQDMLKFNKVDLNLSALRNFISLNDKQILDSLHQIEQIFKGSKFDMNIVINSFYFSNFPSNLLQAFSKISIDDYRTMKEFLKKFYMELAKLLFFTKIEDGTFLNLVRILNSIVANFSSFHSLSCKERIVNSIIVTVADYLIANLDEILDLLLSFDHKLLNFTFSFPINLFKIYMHYHDPNNPEKKYLASFQRYIQFLYHNTANIIDPEIFSEVNKVIVEYSILNKQMNHHGSTEKVELLSKFLELTDNFDKNTWFDNNILILSHTINQIDYNEVIDLTLSLLSDTRNILNPHTRIHTLFNLFQRLIMVNIDYSNFFEGESLILCLFKQDWFVFLINSESINDKESRFRHDLFISLIEALFYGKSYILRNGLIKKYIYLIKICLDIIDVCFKIIEWEDEGEAYKMYFLVLEETCLFFDDPFFCFLFGQEKEFMQMKGRLQQVLVEISKRFTSKVWNNLAFANENSKYRSLLLLSQFLDIDNVEKISTIIDVICDKLHMELNDSSIRSLEGIIRACVFLGIRVNVTVRAKIITILSDFVEKISNNNNLGGTNLNVMKSFAENVLFYLLEHKSDPQIILDNLIVDKLNNEFYLVIPKDIESNIMQKTISYNNLYLINLCENSHMILSDAETEEGSSCEYLDYFRKFYYYPLLEFNNDYSHILIENKLRYKSSKWQLITGTSDAVHAYYMFRIDIETKEIEAFVKCFNSSPCVLNNVSFQFYLSKNLVLETNKEQTFQIDLLSPFACYEFSGKFRCKAFERNNIGIVCTFDLATETTSNLSLDTNGFYIPLTDFFVSDRFALYDIKKFDVFYSSLDYSFTCKCFATITPEELLHHLNERFTMIEFKSNTTSIDKVKTLMDKIKEENYKDYFRSHSGGGYTMEENMRYNFKIKLSSFCVYNFWIYIVIVGDYNFQNNKSILNIEIKSNDLNALSIISRERHLFISEMMNKQVHFY